MIHIRANRDNNGFVELHIKSGGESMDFPGCQYITVYNLNDLIGTLQQVQRFIAKEPESNYRTWEAS